MRIACFEFCPFCQFFTVTTSGEDSLRCGISTGPMSDRGRLGSALVEHKISASSARPGGPDRPGMSSKASAVRHLGAQRLGRFAIDDTFEFGRAGTPEPSGRSSLSARRQRFCCFRCLVTCRSGTASGKWTPCSKPEVRQASTEFGFATIVEGTRLRPTSYVQRQWAPIGVPGLG